MQSYLWSDNTYYYVCEGYNSTLCWQVQRFSLIVIVATDEEIITIYLFCVTFQEKHKIKSMHKIHFRPCYEIFISRLNRISSIFPSLVDCLLDDLDKIEAEMPIKDKKGLSMVLVLKEFD